MEHQKDKHISEIMEYPFDFERYIEERLREIDDLDERRFAKTVLLEGLGRVIGCTEKKYKALEHRVFKEIEMEDNQYEAVITVVSRAHYDPTNGTLYPVIPEDLDEKGPAESLSPEMSSDGKLCLGTIFLKMDCAGIQCMTERKSFAGSITIMGEKKEVSFLLHPAGRYRAMMESLYQVFQDNHIPWETVNTGYLDKFYDVYLTNTAVENLPEALTFSDVNIEFGEFEDHILYDMLPLWNMEWVTFDSADFMLPCTNGIYYEHEFSLEDKEAQDGYLIKTNEDILEIRHETGKIVIKSQKETFEGWKALRIIQRETVRSLDYTAPLLTNHKRDSFFRRYSAHSRVQLMTKTDLFRRIMELDIRDYIEVTDYEICGDGRNYPVVEGMNWFVRDELFPMESRKVLLLRFEAKNPGYYLNDSIVRFVISQMQLEISEYRLVGVIV